MKLFKLPLLVILTFCSATAFAQPIKIDVQKGQKYVVETNTKLASSAEIMGQTMENNTDSKNNTLYEILNTGQDGISLQSTVTKLTVNTTMMSQTMTFDSDKKDNEGPMADELSKMVNKPKKIDLDNNGNIIKQDNDEKSAGFMMVAGSNPSSIELFIPSLVGKELKVGDSYPNITSVKRDKFESRDTGIYKITAIENGIASISYTGTEVVALQMEQMGMEMTSNGTNTVKSELQIDVKTGMVIARATVVESTTTVEASGMTIPSTGKTITTITITPVK